MAPAYNLTAYPLKGLDDAKEIDATVDGGCAIRKSGQAVCWGDNGYGQIGDGTFCNPLNGLVNCSRAVPTPVLGLTDAVDITAGGSYNCAIRATSQAVCWGGNSFGQLGDGTRSDAETQNERYVPTPVLGLDDAISISAGHHHACAIRGSSKPLCWGSNSGGQLGDGSLADRLTPVPVKDLEDATEISTGDWTTCALRISGQALCWGNRTGDGSGSYSLVPTRVVDGPVTVSARLEVTKSGAGRGKVGSSPAGIDCGAICSEEFVNCSASCPADYPERKKVTLSAAPAAGSRSIGWSGACSGSATTCEVSLWDETQRVSAVFAAPVLGPLRVNTSSKSVKRGRKATFKVRVSNVGDLGARGVKVCTKAPKVLVKVSQCVRIGALPPGGAKTVNMRLAVNRKAKQGRAAKITFTAAGNGMAKSQAGVRIRVK